MERLKTYHRLAVLWSFCKVFFFYPSFLPLLHLLSSVNTMNITIFFLSLLIFIIFILVIWSQRQSKNLTRSLLLLTKFRQLRHPCNFPPKFWPINAQCPCSAHTCHRIISMAPPMLRDFPDVRKLRYKCLTYNFCSHPRKARQGSTTARDISKCV